VKAHDYILKSDGFTLQERPKQRQKVYQTPSPCKSNRTTISSFPLIAHLVLVVTPLETDVHILRNIGRNVLPKLLDILAIDLFRHSKRSIHHLRVKRKEVLRNLAGSRILAVQARNKSSLVAVIVELEVDAALWEHSALEFIQVTGDLLVRLGRGDQSILEHVAELEVGAFDQSEELGGARVHVWCVDTAGLEEAERRADAQAGQDREGFDVGSLESTACCVGCRGCAVEAEDRKGSEVRAGEEGAALDQQALEALDRSGSGEEVSEEPSLALCGRCSGGSGSWSGHALGKSVCGSREGEDGNLGKTKHCDGDDFDK
jgi:hypothetical protein